MKTLAKVRARSRRRGSAILEFVAGFSLMIGVFGGVFQFGYGFYVYNNLETLVDNGAKYAALRTYDATTVPPSTCWAGAVKNMVAYGDPTGNSSVRLAPNLSPANVAVNVTFGNGVPQQMTVSISNYTVDMVFQKITLAGKPQVTYPFLGRYSPSGTCTP